MSPLPRHLVVRARKLIFALVASAIGIPAGLILDLPYVFILSIIGVAASLFLLDRNAKEIQKFREGEKEEGNKGS